MIGVNEILKTRLLELIKSVQPTGRWKLVVADSLSLKILNSACKMYDILEENVTLVENIEKQRQPYPSLEAVYILTPCQESCTRLVDDFTRKDGPMYAAAHVHFINGLDNDVFEDFTRKLNAAGVSKYIVGLKEMYIDFMVREKFVYLFDDKRMLRTLFGVDSSNKNRTLSANQISNELDDIAKQLLCVCVTLGENPLIRYHRPLDVEDTINRNIPQHLAKKVQDELDNFCKINPEFPPPRDPPLPRGTLILLDRTIDPISPFLHEFTYQAMLADLLQVEDTTNGLKYSYEYTQEDGTSKDQEVTLNEQDSVYTSIRHLHIAETSEQLIEEFNKLVTENKGSGSQDSAKTVKELKHMIFNLPQYQEMKTKFSAHMTIANECMAEFNKRRLEPIGLLEQNMACGQMPDGSAPKAKEIFEELLSNLDDPYSDNVTKTRLIMLWIATSEKVDDEELKLLLAHARLENNFKEAIDNIKLLGVQLSKSANKHGEKAKKFKKTQVEASGKDVPFDLSRYVPVVKRIVEGHMRDTIKVNDSLFPYLRPPQQQGPRRDSDHHHKPVQQLRVYRTQWHKKTAGHTTGPKPPSGSPVIIFIVGGMTYSEIRSAYELADALDREVYIGSTHIIKADEFVADLAALSKDPGQRTSVVPPYISNIHSHTSASTASATTKRHNNTATKLFKGLAH